MGLQKDFGWQVRRHRMRMGLSQLDLAEAIGRSPQMIGRIERGASAPSFETLEQIARVLETPPHAFFAPSNLDASQAAVDRIVHRLSDLTPDEMEWMDGLIATALRRPQAKPRGG